LVERPVQVHQAGEVVADGESGRPKHVDGDPGFLGGDREMRVVVGRDDP